MDLPNPWKSKTKKSGWSLGWSMSSGFPILPMGSSFGLWIFLTQQKQNKGKMLLVSSVPSVDYSAPPHIPTGNGGEKRTPRNKLYVLPSEEPYPTKREPAKQTSSTQKCQLVWDVDSFPVPYSFSQNHGSGKWSRYLKGNYDWRYTHFSLNHDYGRKGTPILQPYKV